jgi:hypothetical protein
MALFLNATAATIFTNALWNWGLHSQANLVKIVAAIVLNSTSDQQKLGFFCFWIPPHPFVLGSYSEQTD